MQSAARPGGVAEPLGLLAQRCRRARDVHLRDPEQRGDLALQQVVPAADLRHPDFARSSPREFRALRRHVRAFAQTCRKRTGPLLDHVDTATVARDMEALRTALGDGKLNFLGLSYGAEIGTLYAERYPRRIRVMALDGILDHSIGTGAVLADGAAAYEDTLNRFAAWCAQAPECPLHGRDVLSLFDALVARADQQPIAVPGCASAGCRSPVAGDDIRLNAYDLLLFKNPIPAFGLPGWSGFAQALAAAEGGDASAFATPLVSSARDGTFAGLAVNCLDYPPLIGSFRALRASTMLTRALAPRTQGAGEAWPALVRCMDWPAPTPNPPHRARIHGAPPILLVNATHDPSTPYRWAHDLLGQIPRAVLLTRDGDGHTSSLLHPSRTSDAIARYLITRRTPAPNTVYQD
jgi:pimeloyl-ACP methyl ester carboxylesterase